MESKDMRAMRTKLRFSIRWTAGQGRRDLVKAEIAKWETLAKKGAFGELKK